MTQKICLVTGANSGIGKEISQALALAGAHVIMVCRNAEKGKRAFEEIKAASGSTSIDLLIADLSSQTEIRSLAQIIRERYSALHVLINNAALVLVKKTFSADGIEKTLATNHLAPFLLTDLLLDLLQQSAPARIINISSSSHRWAKIDLHDLQYHRRKYQFMKAYAQSKLLMNIATFELARRLEGSGITINCVDPGAVKTNLASENATNRILKFLDQAIKFFFISPQKAAKTPFHLALAPDMQHISGKYFVKGKSVPASAISYDPMLAKNVWEMSKKLVAIT